MQHLLHKTVELTQEAGKIVNGYYNTNFDIREKSFDNPVTIADIACDGFLKETLLDLLPKAGWLSEETKDNPNRLDKEFIWCVDPIDGTKEYIDGIDEFVISVALVHEREVVLGVILNPVTKELFTAAKGYGFYYNGEQRFVSNESTLEHAILEASRSERKRGEFEPFEDMVTIMTVGSVAYKLARVAAGISDLTWSRGPKNEWDICAGALLVAEAGGTVVDLSNRPIRFNQRHPKVNGIIADNGRLHDQVLTIISPHGPARKEAEIRY